MPANATKEQKKEVDDLADEIVELNADLKPRFTKVPKGFKVKLVLPKNQTYVTPAETTLGKVAQEKLGSERLAPLCCST